MIKTGLLVFDKEAYYYPEYSNCLYPFRSDVGYKYIKKISKELNIAVPAFWLNKDIMDYDRLVVTDSAMSVGLGKTLQQRYGKDKIALYYMNSINERNALFMEYFDVIKTYSKEDAETYGIAYKHTPYGHRLQDEGCTGYTFDVVFLGMEKDRGEEIKRIYKALVDEDLICKFMVPGMRDNEIGIKDPIEYSRYLEFVKQSRCIAEVVGPGQRGITLRYMESLFLGKKLITNNLRILEDEYYDHRNVYVLGVERKDDIKSFVQSEYIDRHEGIDELELSNWLDSFWGR